MKGYELFLIFASLLILFMICGLREGICVQRSYGVITEMPASDYVNANIAYRQGTDFGSQPLGETNHWIPHTSPIFQGMYGLYQPTVVPLADAESYDPEPLRRAAMSLPVYTSNLETSNQCTQL